MRTELFQEVWAIRKRVFYSGIIVNRVESDVLTIKLECGTEKDFYSEEIYTDFDEAVADYARLNV